MEYLKSIQWPEESLGWKFAYYTSPSLMNRSSLEIEDGDYYGRFTFDKADSIRTSRGEHLPYPFDYDLGKQNFRSPVYEVINSNWLKERYEYEKKYYGNSYEFGGSVQEMVEDFHHYVIGLQDEFIEVIARGFWYESDEKPLVNDGLEYHPLKNLKKENPKVISRNGLEAYIYFSTLSHDEILNLTQYCPQKVLQFGIKHREHISISHSLLAIRDNKGQVSYRYVNPLGNELARFDHQAGLEDIQELLFTHMDAVSERRKAMQKLEKP